MSYMLDWLWAWAVTLWASINPSTSVRPCSGPEDLARCVSDLIIFENSGPKYVNGVVFNPDKGTQIHKISKETADTLAETVISASKQTGLPLSYGLACMCAESLFDPQCQNGNYLGSNKAKDPDGYDVGIAQLKLKYLYGTNGIKDVASAQAFALDPSKAIPYCFNSMNTRLGTADEFIASTISDKTEFSGFHNRFYVATAMYNFGKTGFAAMAHNLPLSHCEIVQRYERLFSQTLGEPSVFGAAQG